MKFLRVVIIIICIFSIIFSIVFKTEKFTSSKLQEKNDEGKIILSIWQIDTFEGGTGSRRQFLESVTNDFESKNPNVLVMVTNHTIEGVKESFEKDVFPDLISYGNGVELKNLTEIKNVKSFKGGIVDDKTFATPWCRGGYYLIANAKKIKSIDQVISNVIISQSEYTLPIIAFFKDNFSAKNYFFYKPLDAYVNFVAGKSDWLLGTVRDLDRLERRGFQVITKPIENYNDLYQYISITTKNEDKVLLAQEFIELLLSERHQKRLNEIKMYSVFYQMEYNSSLNGSAKFNNFLTVQPFLDSGLIKEIQNQFNISKTIDESLNYKINKLLI